MADTRVSLIRNARLRFGEPPRSLDPKDRYLRPRKPLPGLAPRGHRRACDALAEAFENGLVVWGAMAVARTDLFKKGDVDGRGVIVYCPEPHVHDHLDGLAEASLAVQEYRERRGLDAEGKAFSRMIGTNNDWFASRPLPEAIEADDRLRIASILVVRKHLALKRLAGNYLPIVADTKSGGVAILPERFWPQEMHDYWTQAAQ